MAVGFALQSAFHAQRAAGEELCKHLVEKDDDRGLELLIELVSAYQMQWVLLEDNLAPMRKQREKV
ncbi:MAG: hypothetical protein WBE55_22140 [Candidatus Sulfotelmatobacter sp.]